MLSDPVMLALIGGVPATLVALGALFQSISNSKKHDVTDKKVDKIGTQTDGALSTMLGQLQAASVEIANLREIIRIITEGKSEETRVQILKQKEALETRAMEEMQAHADTKVELMKAKLSPPVDPRDL